MPLNDLKMHEEMKIILILFQKILDLGKEGEKLLQYIHTNGKTEDLIK